MNYLWQYLLNAKEQGIDKDLIQFRPARSYSPYMELSQEEINNTEIDPDQLVEINPYYRFYTIFKNIFSPDIEEYEELRLGLFQLIVHMIGQEDLKQGMNRGEYYKKFLYRDIFMECYGKDVKDTMVLFNTAQHHVLLSGVLKLYSVGANLDLLKEVITKLFSNSIVYHNSYYKDEVLVYIGAKKSKDLDKKVSLVLKLFADLKYSIELYYQYHFAILGVGGTCIMDEIAIY